MSILKKALGVLKILRVAAPAAILATGITGLCLSINYGQSAKDKEKETKEAILKSPVVVQLVEKDLSIYEERFKNQEITTDEYVDKVEYYQSTEYVDDIINLPELSQEKENLQRLKKEVEKADNIACCGFVVTGIIGFLGVVGSVGFYLSEDGRYLLGDWIEEGIEDFKYVDPKRKAREESKPLEIDID